MLAHEWPEFHLNGAAPLDWGSTKRKCDFQIATQGMTMEPEPFLVPIGLDAFVAFFGALAVIIAVLFWYLNRKEKEARKQFFVKFEANDLRMSPYQIGLVYRVTGASENTVSVVPIWRGKSPITNGKEQTLEPSHLIPFDKDRFL